MTEKTNEWIGIVEKVNIHYQFAEFTLPHISIQVKCSDLEIYNKLKKTLREFSEEEWGYDGSLLDLTEIEEMMNTFNDENEQLEEDLHNIRKAQISDIQSFEELLTEIEKLKSICQDHRDHAIDFKADCVRLEKENEELKSELRYYRLRDTPKWRAKW